MYQAVGITEPKEFRNLQMFGSDFTKSQLFYRAQNKLAEEGMVVCITLDMDKRTVKVNGKFHENLPREVYAAVCIKSESGAVITHLLSQCLTNLSHIIYSIYLMANWAHLAIPKGKYLVLIGVFEMIDAILKMNCK